MKQASRYLLTFCLGVIVGGVVATVLVAKRWRDDFANSYVAGVAGEAFTAREIYRGHGEQTADRIRQALPSLVTAIETEFPHVQGRESTYWLVRDVYESKGVPLPADISGVLSSLPPRSGCKPPVSRTIKKGAA
jgi:hypothetical protein